MFTHQKTQILYRRLGGEYSFAVALDDLIDCLDTIETLINPYCTAAKEVQYVE